MVTPRKSPSRYAPQLFQLFRDAVKDSRTILFTTPEAAVKGRAKLYAFRTALLNEPSFDPEVAVIMRAATMTLAGSTLTITYEGTSHGRDSSNSEEGTFPSTLP